MAKTTYNISLKGYVGGSDFDRSTVDRELARHDGKQVNVLIDSLGGSLATGLSISAAFRNYGNVNVDFVGLNASAATIASLGAAHISIDTGAMYLVHKCSMAFFEWGSLNSDQFATLIADCEKIKADLDKLDQNVARLYAARCKRKPEDLLALMKAGGWLSPQEALDWGFVNEITDLAEDAAPRLTEAFASAMASEGMPIPNILTSPSSTKSLCSAKKRRHKERNFASLISARLATLLGVYFYKELVESHSSSRSALLCKEPSYRCSVHFVG